MPAIINIKDTSFEWGIPRGRLRARASHRGCGWARLPIGQRGHAATNNDNGLSMGSAAVRRVSLSVEAQEDPGLAPGARLVVSDYWLLGAGDGA